MRGAMIVYIDINVNWRDKNFDVRRPDMKKENKKKEIDEEKEEIIEKGVKAYHTLKHWRETGELPL